MSVTGAAAEVAALDAIGQAELVRRREVMPTELVTWAIERIEDLNPRLNAVVTLMFDQALAAAQLGCSGPFAGVPYLLKDLAAETAGVRFTEGSRFLRGYVSRYDSELVRRLRRAGLVIVGKANTPEFGLVPTCEPEALPDARKVQGAPPQSAWIYQLMEPAYCPASSRSQKRTPVRFVVPPSEKVSPWTKEPISLPPCWLGPPLSNTTVSA